MKKYKNINPKIPYQSAVKTAIGGAVVLELAKLIKK